MKTKARAYSWILLLAFPLVAHGNEKNQLDIGCNIPGECLHGSSTGLEIVDSVEECISLCESRDACFYYTFSPDDGLCIEYADCEEVSTDACENCLSGNKNCLESPCKIPGWVNNLDFTFFQVAY